MQYRNGARGEDRGERDWFCGGIAILSRSREVGVCETTVETIYRVLPRHANPLGTLHGGRVMEWMIGTGTLAASRFSEGPVVLGWLDNVFFLNPVLVGDTLTIRGWVELVGTSSMDVSVVVIDERKSGEKLVTTFAHMAFVAVDDDLRPRRVERRVVAKNSVEEQLQREAMERRERRLRMIAGRREERNNLSLPRGLWDQYSSRLTRMSYPEDAIFANAMHAGRLLFVLDEFAGVMASRYAGGVVVTAAVDSTAFYAPIRIGDFYDVYATISYVGRTTVEVTLKVIAENVRTGRRVHTSTAYFTMVHLGEDLRPKPVPRYPVPEDRVNVLQAAEERRKRRMERLSVLKARLRDLKL